MVINMNIFSLILKQTKRTLCALLALVLVALSSTQYVAAQAKDECSEQALRNKQVAMLDCKGDTKCTTAPIIAGGGVDRFLQVLSSQESGGNPKAQSGSSSASGKYQYINSTWKARASLYGPSGQYARAADAPEEVQDAVAYIEYTQQFKSLNSDLFKLAVNHYLPAALKNEALLDQVPPRNKITPRQYGEMLVQNIGKGVGANIPLKYKDAPEFDVWLSKVGGAPTDTANTQSISPQSCGAASQAASSIGGTVVEIAQRELAARISEADNGYHKYTGGVSAAWCAYFVSWVFKEAGKPFNESGGTLPAAAGILAYAKKNGIFHPKGEAGFTPQPGDVAIYKENLNPYPSHVNIVISFDPATNKYTSIGGNESNAIKQASIRADLPALTGFMRVP